MKAISILPLALVASAFVIPDAETLRSLEVQNEEAVHSFWDNIPNPETIWEDLEDRFDQATKSAKHRFNEAVDYAQETVVDYSDNFQEAFAGQAWYNSGEEDVLDGPHHGRPGHGRPGHGPPDHEHPPHRRPHHPHDPHHGAPNRTVYELIAESKYTTKLAKAISEFPDLVELLNGTAANYTVFAPTDAAFAKIPEKAPKPPKSFLKKLLTYHVSPEFYPAGKVLVTRTIPTALQADLIGEVPQRLSTQIGFRGLTVNFYARIVAIDIFGTNGVIHGIDSLLLPPPKIVDIISILPGEFSTLELGLRKTGLYEAFNDTSAHSGGTFFAPSNFAFQKLGPRINAFLFSKYGEKYLKALLLYHAGPNITLYSDAIYKIEEDEKVDGGFRIPRGQYHVDIPTGLEGKSLSIDIGRYGRLIDIRINGFTSVSVSDGIAADGVLQVLSSVLIPPKSPGQADTLNLELEDFISRMAPFVEEVDDDAQLDIEDVIYDCDYYEL